MSNYDESTIELLHFTKSDCLQVSKVAWSAVLRVLCHARRMALAEAPPAPADNGAGPRDADNYASVDTSKYTLFSQGAEARAWKGTFLGRPAVLKERFSKGYRHPTLDTRLTLHRTKAEMRGLLKARKLGVETPVMYSADVKTGMMIQECVDGISVREALQQDSLPNRDAILKAIGQRVAKMHDGGLIHGDLTTSNMLLRHEDQSLVRFKVDEYAGVMIDFGLSYNSILPEDKGVDLYVLERAFASAHAGDAETMFDVVLTAYRQSSRMWSATLNRFAEVRTRGRKRSMVG